MTAKPPQEKRAPQGVALSIGINKPDRTYYGNEFDALKGAERDAREMSRLATENEFRPILLLGDRATWDAIMREIKTAAASLQPEDIFLLTYSGHGSVISPSWIENNLERRPSSVEPREWVQTWVLFDRELLDKELRRIWTTFQRGVRILVVLDSCHSFSAIDLENYSDPALRSRLFSPKEQASVLERDKEYYKKKLQESLSDQGARSSTTARVLALSACRDDQQAGEGDGLGLFTEELMAAQAKDPKDYTALVETVKQSVLKRNPDQTPGLYPYPDGESFASERPFTIRADR